MWMGMYWRYKRQPNYSHLCDWLPCLGSPRNGIFAVAIGLQPRLWVTSSGHPSNTEVQPAKHGLQPSECGISTTRIAFQQQDWWMSLRWVLSDWNLSIARGQSSLPTPELVPDLFQVILPRILVRFPSLFTCISIVGDYIRLQCWSLSRKMVTVMTYNLFNLNPKTHTMNEVDGNGWYTFWSTVIMF